MNAYEMGKLWGAIFIAGLPTAAYAYHWCAVKKQQKTLGWFAAGSCFLSGFLGGLIFSLPTMGVFMLIAKVLAPEVMAQPTPSTNTLSFPAPKSNETKSKAA